MVKDILDDLPPGVKDFACTVAMHYAVSVLVTRCEIATEYVSSVARLNAISHPACAGHAGCQRRRSDCPRWISPTGHWLAPSGRNRSISSAAQNRSVLTALSSVWMRAFSKRSTL